MNWQNVSFDWNQTRAFLATMEEGSLSAAARALDVTPPTLGRQVAALESTLDIVLFERIGKSLTPTPIAFEIADQVRKMFDAANQISLTALGQSEELVGRVRITASDVISAYILPQAIKKIKALAPLVEIEVISSNNIQDLQMREADIAIRHVRPEQPELIAKLICDSTGYFYASETYLKQKGAPKVIADLKDHNFIGFGDNPRMLEVLHPLGIPLTLHNFKQGSENGIVAWEMARSNIGIVIMADNIAASFPDMERLSIDMEPFNFPVWLVSHKELHTSGRIRIVFDVLAEFLAEKMT